MKKKILLLLSFVFLVNILTSCIDENDKLVNPPSNIETVNVRFINFGSDNNNRYMTFNGTSPTNDVSYANSSDANHPPADSAIISIRKSGTTEFTVSRMVKFSRNVNYSFFALPSPKGDSVYKAVDTVVTLTTSLAMPSYSTDAYIKLFNAYPDSTITFSLLVGCPNSDPLFSNVPYRACTIPTFIRTGKVPISILKISKGISEVVGTYEADLITQGQYAVVIGQDQTGNVGVYILDEKDLKSSGFHPAIRIEQRFANIRLINLSSTPVSAVKTPSEVIAQDLQTNYTGNYSVVSSCNSNAKDSVVFLSNNSFATNYTYSFEVLEKYSFVIGDSANKPANNAVLVPPSRISNLNGKSAIRVINLAWNYSSLDLSVASRQDNTDSLGFSAGLSLAKTLKFGTISSSVIITPGNIPLALFTSFSPVELLLTSITYIEANKEYLIIISNDASGNITMKLVESNNENSQVQNIENTSFIQIINSISRSNKVQLTLTGLIDNAKLYYTNTLATNIKITNQNITFLVNGISKTVTFTPKISSRYSLILCGDKDNPDFLLLENDIKAVDTRFAERRFVNASQDLTSIWVVENITKDTIPSSNLIFKDFSPFDLMDKAKRYTFYFFDPETKKKILSFDIDITLGKRYTMIFAGTNKDKFGYSVMEIQEY